MPETPKDRPVVMVSSTALDLPEHRKQVLDACLRQGMIPLMMEHLPASGSEAVTASLKMVEESDIYVAVLAHRYGHVPEGHDISLTEMEYERAVSLGIPRLIFIMHRKHLVEAAHVEVGEAAEKLKRFKNRLEAENIVPTFTSPEDLRAHVIDGLSRYRKPNFTALQYVGHIPSLPEPYRAYNYTLLQTKTLVGRAAELDILTEWASDGGEDSDEKKVLSVVAIGGEGKSALTWKWFNDIAPRVMEPLAGSMWWSFYERGATFENFIIRGLAYAAGKTVAEIQGIPPADREAQFLSILNNKRFLLVLDGLERIMVAYARMDADRLLDEDLDRETANTVAGGYGLPAGASQTFAGRHPLRKTADPRAGEFLRRLASIRASRVLISTRLYPAELQTATGEPVPGSGAYSLPGLCDKDAYDLWRAFGVSGSPGVLLPIFHTFKNHALLIQALASEVAYYRRAPGDFNRWRAAHRKFNPYRLQLKQVRSHVLEFALSGLDDAARRVLYNISAFRMPTTYDTLASLLVGDDEPRRPFSSVTPFIQRVQRYFTETRRAPDEMSLQALPGLSRAVSHRPFDSDSQLDASLTELEARGLLGWDRRANRYDLHPIVRGVVWTVMDDGSRQRIYGTLHRHFEPIASVGEEQVESLEDLGPGIELYNALIGQKRYDDALRIFRERLCDAMYFRLGLSWQRAELLKQLFPDGEDAWPKVQKREVAFTLNALALDYMNSGQLDSAVRLFRSHNEVVAQWKDDRNLSVGRCNLATALCLSGRLYESEVAARQALTFAHTGGGSLELSSLDSLRLGSHDGYHAGLKISALHALAGVLMTRGLAEEARATLDRALQHFPNAQYSQWEGMLEASLAHCELLSGKLPLPHILAWADRALELGFQSQCRRDLIRAARLQGEAALGMGEFAHAEERLRYALSLARGGNAAKDEFPALVHLADLRRQQGELKNARELLNDLLEPTRLSDQLLAVVDALNTLAEIERDEGHKDAAVEAAVKAYMRAWCDGPPFAYHQGLGRARRLLRELGAEEPEMPAFDASKFDPMA